MLSLRTIVPNTLELLQRIASEPEMAKMRLVGGTSLALQYGHRQSIDLDFFATEDFDQDTIVNLFNRIGNCSILNKSKTILQVDLNKVKVDVVNLQNYPWIDEPIKEDGIVLASDKDIAAMKINAIIGRGTKKDFIDLYVLLQHYSLAEILDFYRQRYPDYSDYRAMLSLTYFEDAETQEMPVMFIPDTWEQMKKTIIKSVKDYQK